MINPFLPDTRISSRATLAWFLACEVAGAIWYLLLVLPSFVRNGLPPHLTGLGGLAIAVLPLFTFGLLIAGFTFWAVPPLVFAIRVLRVPRPAADILLGGAPGYIAFAAVLVSSGEVDPGFLWFAVVLCISGWTAGGVYWSAADKPRPPY